jgi:TetR/AcrR family transcriptional regulator, mexJK operon transcriptional repressor
MAEAGVLAESGRGGEARRRILDAAAEVFRRDGYRGATVESIAALAGSSKQTIYKHFGAKEGLFEQIVHDGLVDIDQLFADAMEQLTTTDEIEPVLRTLAHRFVHSLTRPAALRLRRLVVAEAGRFPKLGRAYFEAGPERVHALLASAFASLVGRGLMVAPDPMLAANHFTWLTISIPVNEVMLCGDDVRFTKAELERFADAAVEVFMAAYVRPARDAALGGR